MAISYPATEIASADFVTLAKTGGVSLRAITFYEFVTTCLCFMDCKTPIKRYGGQKVAAKFTHPTALPAMTS